MKAALRSQKLLERLDHHPQTKEQKDLLIIERIIQLPEFQKARNILFYYAIRGEVNLLRLFEFCVKKMQTDSKESFTEKFFILPRVQNNTLDLHFIQDLSHVEKGIFDLYQPQSHLPQAAFEEIDLALVPGVVFARNGHRIGYGKGFYDRILPKLHCPKIGIAYDFQIVKNIDGEMHDVPMDMIVTEKEVIVIKN